MLARSAVALLLLAGCAAPPPTEVQVATASDLVAALGRAGWTVRPTTLLTPTGLFSAGTAYTAELVPPRRTLLVFDTTEDGGPMAPERIDSDVTQLRRAFAGQGAVVYRRPRLLVVTFGRARGALDDRLEQWLGRPVSALPGGERSGS